MQRYTLRVLVASFTFAIGLAVVTVLHLIPIVETDLVDWLYTSENVQVSTIGPMVLDSAEDVNEVYRVLVREKFTLDDEAKLIVLQSHTTGCPMYEDESSRIVVGNAEPFQQIVKEMMPEVGSQVLDDYLAKNRTQEPLEVSNLGINYVMLKDSDLPDDEFDRFWTKFYKKFPDSSGIVFLSQVGFNSQHNQAFVYAGRTCGGLCGSGEYVLLKKQYGKWVIQQERGLWVS